MRPHHLLRKKVPPRRLDFAGRKVDQGRKIKEGTSKKKGMTIKEGRSRKKDRGRKVKEEDQGRRSRKEN